MKSVMNHSFSRVPHVDIPRSSFDRSHGYKTTFDAGLLIPFYTDEVLPGDTFNVNASIFARLITPIAPIMDNLILDTFFFAVPNRLLWENWERFNGAQDDPDSDTDFIIPQMVSPASGGYDVASLSDYFGIPTAIEELSHSALWHRAYNLIYNEWFRDQNLQNSVVVDLGDADSDPDDYVLLRRGKRHDYFTSCLPWPQKGPSVPLPIGESAPVRHGAGTGANIGVFSDIQDAYKGMNATTTVTSNTVALSAGESLYADLSGATASTINQLRQSFQIQKMYEKDSRGGTRYTELIKSHFGVTSPDARLQRPEYLGGGSSRVNINPVPQTSEANTTPQGTMSAYGTMSAHNHGFTKSFTEHCTVIGITCLRADLSYQEGLDRKWSRNTRFDFFWPALAHLGEQSVLNKEIYAQGSANPTEDADVFGYQERYAEYRYMPSKITGLFRSQAAGTLELWHLAQKFGSLPALNAAFIEEHPPIDRITSVPSEPHVLFDSYISIKSARPMPTYSVPGLIDHF